MHAVEPSSLGDAYPALGNFLKLTALTLEASQVVLTVQRGQHWRNGGVMNYGHLSAAALREVLASQPVAGSTVSLPPLSLTTYHRTPLADSGAIAPVLVGQLATAEDRYRLTIYVPGLAVVDLRAVSLQTLQGISELLLLCLSLADLPAPAPLAPAPAAVDQPGRVPLPLVDREVPNREVAGDLAPIQDLLLQNHPRLVDLVAQMQSCLSYQQLGRLLALYLPNFFPHQSGRLAIFREADPNLAVLTQWGDRALLHQIKQQCCYSIDPTHQLAMGSECHQCQVTYGLGQTIRCIILGQLERTTCLVQLAGLEGGSFSPGQTALLKQLSEQILYVMQRLLLLEDLQDQALKDPLTGLLNRRHLETLLTRLCQGSQGHPMISVLMVDIDHFKHINDTYGHPAGDVVLKQVAMLLRGHGRSKDLVCRYGGEEFCMVLLNTELDVAFKRAEKIRRAVKYVNSSYQGQMLPPVTISLGVASFPRHGETPEELITLADKALYWAKNHGRDRTASIDQMRAALDSPSDSPM
jgi:diguanylate cyclase (GGDEF)-like protein